MNFDAARKIADAVLYEGYVLYPYRASSGKNQFRWQFGVVAPRAWSENGGCEPWEMQTECLVEPQGSPSLDIKVRFLQIQARTGDGWEEGIEREADLRGLSLAALLETDCAAPFEIPGEQTAESERWPVSALVRVSAEPAGRWVKLRVRVENVTPWQEGSRSEAVRRSLAGAHLLLGVSGGAFVSSMDPPPQAPQCANLHAWPVLVGEKGQRDLMLAAPIILYDYPEIAPESHGDFFDGTEIDELLTLRVMTLTDEEKLEACGTDERARRIVERSDAIPREVFEKLHGAIRSMAVAKGARVILRPRRRADSMDLFLAGRVARIVKVERDVEGKTYVAVAVEDDPALDLADCYGRFFYFYPDELELVEGIEKEPNSCAHSDGQ